VIPFPFQAGQFGRASAAANVSGWTPASLGTFPFLWYDPATAVTDAGAGACSRWDNQNVNGYYLEQSSPGDRPLIVPGGVNGLRLLRFDGTSQFMRTAGPSPRAIFQNASYGYIFVVFKRAVSTGGGATRLLMFNGNNTTNGARFSLYCDNTTTGDKMQMIVRRLDADSAATLTGTVSVNSGWHMALAIMDWSVGDGFIYVDGTLDVSNTSLTTSGNTSNTAATSNSSLAAGQAGGAYADIDCPELFAGAYLPTAGEIDRIFGYAAHRYGLTSLLPGGHPYKTTPP
jgi:hypothetical protein